MPAKLADETLPLLQPSLPFLADGLPCEQLHAVGWVGATHGHRGNRQIKSGGHPPRSVHEGSAVPRRVFQCFIWALGIQFISPITWKSQALRKWNARLSWVEFCPSRKDKHAAPWNVILFGNRIFTDIIKSTWGPLSNMTGIFIEGNFEHRDRHAQRKDDVKRYREKIAMETQRQISRWCSNKLRKAKFTSHP